MARVQETEGDIGHGRGRFWFGPFCYDSSQAQLRRGDEEISLPPRALDLLEYLLQRPSEVVGKDELLDAVWDGRIVGDESLTQAISVIRHALGDDPQAPTYIRTVPRRGYLFVSEVRHDPSHDAGRRGWPRWRLIAVGVLVLLSVTAGYWLTQERRAPNDPVVQGAQHLAVASKRTTIAILSFENLGPPEDAYFAAGITEEVTSRLASVSSLGVVSGKGSRRNRASDRAIAKIGAEYGVDYVLEGAVRWAKNAQGPDRVRITPRLIRVEDGIHLWAEVYDRELKDIFALQSEIAGKVLAELGVRLAVREQKVVEARPTDSLEAYQAHLRAREIHVLLGDYGVAAELYRRATQLDPDFAEAYAYLSTVKGDRYRRGVARTAADLADIRQALERALALAPERPVVQLAQAAYYINCEPDYDRALEVAEPLAATYPNLASSQMLLGDVYRRQGRFEEAVRRFERAQALEPDRVGPTRTLLAHVYRGLRRFDAAQAMWNRVIDLRPNSSTAYAQKAYTLLAWRGDLVGARELLSVSPPGFEVSAVRFAVELAAGNHEAAVAVMRQALIDPAALEGPWQEVNGRFRLAFATHLEGRLDAARVELQALEIELEKLLEQQPDSNYYQRYLAKVYTLLGQTSAATQLAQQVVEATADDRYFGPKGEEALAFVYTWSGQTEAALDLVEHLLSIPYWRSLTVARLEFEAEWIPLRGLPRFQAMLQENGK